MANIPAYFQCAQCLEFKPKGKRLKKYCSRKCRDAAYYKRKVEDQLMDEAVKDAERVLDAGN